MENSPAICGAKKRTTRLIEVVDDLFGKERRVRDIDLPLESSLVPVLGKLSEIGYNAVWETLSAAEVGAMHKRDRWWLWGEKNTNADCNGHLHIKDEIKPAKG